MTLGFAYNHEMTIESGRLSYRILYVDLLPDRNDDSNFLTAIIHVFIRKEESGKIDLMIAPP